MLELYTNYKFIPILYSKKKVINLKLIKIKLFITFLTKKHYLSKSLSRRRTHTYLFMLYTYEFLRVGIKKKKKSIRNKYFFQHQQYLY